jgi:hypothetical protein
MGSIHFRAFAAHSVAPDAAHSVAPDAAHSVAPDAAQSVAPNAEQSVAPERIEGDFEKKFLLQGGLAATRTGETGGLLFEPNAMIAKRHR